MADFHPDLARSARFTPRRMITPATLSLFRGAARLMERRTAKDVEVVPGAFHGFDGVVPKAPVSKDFFASQANWLRQYLVQTEPAPG